MFDCRRFLAAAAAAVWIPGGCGRDAAGDRLRAVRYHVMHNVAIAWVAYCQAGFAMPADILAADGTPLWSWRVHLLPFLELKGTYDALKLDEPWNSPHNAPLTAQHIRGTRMQWPDDPPGSTRIMAVRYADALFPDISSPAAAPNPPRLLMVAVGPEFAFPWACPGDLDFSPEHRGVSYGKLPAREFYLAYADGRTECVPERPRPTELLALLDPDGDGKR